MKIFRNAKDECTIPVGELLLEEDWDEAISAAAFLIASEKARGGNLIISDFYDEFNNDFSLNRLYAENVEIQLPEINYGEKASEFKTRLIKKIRNALLGSIVIDAKFVLWMN